VLYTSMKLGRKTLISLFIIIVLLGSSVIAWTQFFGGGSPQEIVVFKTSMGTFEVQMDRQHAPNTVANFENYVRLGFYNGTIFHRVVPGFVIQGGGFTTNGTIKTTNTPIKLESTGLSNKAMTIGMARSTDPNSATSQFYINLVDNIDLDPSSSSRGYAVFGQVVSGMDVIQAIGNVKTETRGQFQNWPIQNVTIIGTYVKP
jgi:peptidyl-prolyl cis-trans isomerase A (cyclophilin A)